MKKYIKLYEEFIENTFEMNHCEFSAHNTLLIGVCVDYTNYKDFKFITVGLTRPPYNRYCVYRIASEEEVEDEWDDVDFEDCVNNSSLYFDYDSTQYIESALFRDKDINLIKLANPKIEWVIPEEVASLIQSKTFPEKIVDELLEINDDNITTVFGDGLCAGKHITDTDALNQVRNANFEILLRNGIDIGVSPEVKAIATAALKGNHKLK